MFAQAGTPAATTGTSQQPAGTGGGENVFRDRDPPPSYDGESPETTFRQFEKAVRLWEFESDIPAKKRGAKLIRALTGAAKLATEDLEFEAITAEDGVECDVEAEGVFHTYLTSRSAFLGLLKVLSTDSRNNPRKASSSTLPGRRETLPI